VHVLITAKRSMRMPETLYSLTLEKTYSGLQHHPADK